MNSFCLFLIRWLQLKVKKLEEENDGHDGDDRPDLVEDGSKAVRSINDETEPTRLNRETSNSTASVGKIADHERLSGDNSKNPDPDHMAATEEEEGTISRRSGMSQSVELGESGTSTVNRKRKGHEYMSGEDNIKPDGNQSQPLIEIIKLIRSHPRGSVFASRLRSQVSTYLIFLDFLNYVEIFTLFSYVTLSNVSMPSLFFSQPPCFKT